MQALKDLATKMCTEISEMRSTSVEPTNPSYIEAMGEFAAVKVALGVLRVGTRTIQKDSKPFLTFTRSARVGNSDYACVKKPTMLIRAVDDNSEVELKELTLMVSSGMTGGKFCCRLLPTYGPHGVEAIGCCWSPIEEGADCCDDCK